MKRFSMLLALCLTLCLALGAVAQADVTYNDYGTSPVVASGDVSLTVAIKESTDVIYENNWMTNYYSELLGGDIIVDLWPASDAETKLTLMVTSGDKLPDVLTFGATDTSSRNVFADAGALYCLDEYFTEGTDSYALFAKRCEEAGDDPAVVLAQVRSLDGHIYAFPNDDKKLPNMYGNRAFINQDFLDALDLEAPTTIDELTNVLIAFRDGDPNGNGIADEIPMSGSSVWNNNCNVLYWLQNMFIYKDSTSMMYNRLDVTDGKLDYTFDEPEYREFLKYVNMLVSEGLLDTASFTQSLNDLRVNLKADVQTVGLVTGSASGFGDNIGSWQPIEQPADANGNRQVTMMPQGIGASWVISADCENPEAAARMAFLGYVGDEMALIQRFGEPGVDWRYAEEGEVSVFKELNIPPHLLVLDNVWVNVTDKYWKITQCLPTLASESTHIEVFDGNELYSERLHGRSVCMNMQYAPEAQYAPRSPIYTDEENEDWGEARNSLMTYVNEATYRFCIGQLDPNSDADWNAYLTELQNLKVDELLAVDNAAYERTYGAN